VSLHKFTTASSLSSDIVLRISVSVESTLENILSGSAVDTGSVASITAVIHEHLDTLDVDKNLVHKSEFGGHGPLPPPLGSATDRLV